MKQQFEHTKASFRWLPFVRGNSYLKLWIPLNIISLWKLTTFLMLICFSSPTLAVPTNTPSLSVTQCVTNRIADVSYNDGWVDENFTKDPKSAIKKLLRGATADSSMFFGLIQTLFTVLPISYAVLGLVLKVLFNKNLFAPFLWFVYLFSYKLRLRRFLSTFKGCEVECVPPYISIDRSCLKEIKNIVKDDQVQPGVYFFYGQRDVGKKVLLVGELHDRGMKVVQIPEESWLKDGNVCHRELLLALRNVFPPFRRKSRLVLILDSQEKDYREYHQVLMQTVNSLYQTLPERLRKRVAIVVKMIGMYAARDIRDVYPVVIEPFSAKECVAFSDAYCKQRIRKVDRNKMDEHILYVNSMGHPSRLINYLKGNLVNDALSLDIKVLNEWDDWLPADVDDDLRKSFYCLIYILSIIGGNIDLDYLIELVTQQKADGKGFKFLKKAIVSIVGWRKKIDDKHFDVDVLFGDLYEERLLIAWNAGNYGIDSHYYFADKLPTILAQCENFILSSSIAVYGEDFSRRMIAACVTDWTDVAKHVPCLIRMFEQMKDVGLRHDIGMRLISVVYKFEWYPRYGIAENEEIAEQIKNLLDVLQEMCWPGWLDAMLAFAPLLCMVNPDISTWGISDKTFEDHLRELDPNSSLPKELQVRVASGLAATYCYGMLTLSKRTRVSGLDRANLVSKLRKYRLVRARIWEMLDDGERVFILRLHRMLSLARVTERDIDAYHGEWSDTRCEAIRAFLDSACQIKTNEFSGVIQAALKSQYYNLFLEDDNHGIISELIQQWEQMDLDRGESQDGFLWTLKWYRACSESTECETPDDVLSVVDRVISELDISGNKCISGNPLTIVDMMWLVSAKFNDIFGLKEYSDGVSKLQERMLDVLKYWCPILCLRGRLRMLNYFSRMIGRIHLSEDDISWIISELRRIYQWVDGDVLLYDNDELKAKILNIGTIVLYAMTGMETFATGGNRACERDELLEMRREIIKYSNKNNSSALCNKAAVTLLLEDNLPLALQCLGLCGHADTTVDFSKAIIAVSRRTRPQISTLTAFKIFQAIVGKLLDLYNKTLDINQAKSDGCFETQAVHTPIPMPDPFKDVVFGLLRKIGSPLCSVGVQRDAPDVGSLFCLHKYRLQLETAIIRFLVSSRVPSKEEVETFRKMSAKHIEELLDAGEIAESVEFCCFILDSRYPMLIDDPSFVKVYNGVENNLLKETPRALSEERKKYETVHRILHNDNFIWRLKFSDISKLFAAWEEMRAHFNPDADGEFCMMDVCWITAKVQREATILEEDVTNAEYVGRSQDGKISISLSSDEVSAINCYDGEIDMEEYFLDVKNAFGMVISEKHKCLESRKKNLRDAVTKMADEINVELDENFELPPLFMGL